MKLTVYRQNALEIVRGLLPSMKEGRPYTLILKRWYKPRSTGARSQNHHINGHCQQISEETGNGFAAVKERMKVLAVDRGYPIETLPDGSIMPKSESEIDTKQAGYLIDAIHQFASEWNINLIETEEW